MSENKLQYECGLIQDLLPLYQDEVCSKSSKVAVEEHLEGCQDCRIVSEKLKNVKYDEELSKEKNSVLNTYAKKEKRRTTTIGMVTAGVLMIPVIVCLICNLAIGAALDWFFIVLASLMVVASVTVVPLLVRENVVMWTMGGFILSLTILLGVICIYTQGSWFALAVVPSVAGLSMLFMPYIIRHISLPEVLKNQKALLTMIVDTICVFAIIAVCGFSVSASNYWGVALPITLYGLTLPWLIFICVRYLRVHPFTKAGIIFFLIGIFNTFMNDVVDAALGGFTKLNILRADFAHWNNQTNNGNVAWIVLITMAVCGIVFLIMGSNRKKDTNHVEG